MRHFAPDLSPAEISAEQWRPVNAAREVSDLGRVRMIDGPLVEPCVVNGYRKVYVGNRNEYVHRLVLVAFVGEPFAGAVAAHGGTGNRGDNRLSSLRWATRAENAADRWEQGTIDSAIRPCIGDLGRLSDAEIGRRCGVGRSTVHAFRVRRGIPRAPTP